MGVCDRHPLSLADSGGIAVIDMGIALEIDGDAPSIVEPHRQSVRRGLFYCAEGAVLHAHLAFEIGRAHSELQSLMRISYAVFCLKKKKQKIRTTTNN